MNYSRPDLLLWESRTDRLIVHTVERVRKFPEKTSLGWQAGIRCLRRRHVATTQFMV
jgi:hypothetical protein